MLSAGFRNIPLTKYLIDQVRQSQDRMVALQVCSKCCKRLGLETANAFHQKKDEMVVAFSLNQSGKCLWKSVFTWCFARRFNRVAIMVELIGRCFSRAIKTQNGNQKLKK
jgi:malate dehydrogenase (quinone)